MGFREVNPQNALGVGLLESSTPRAPGAIHEAGPVGVGGAFGRCAVKSGRRLVPLFLPGVSV